MSTASTSPTNDEIVAAVAALRDAEQACADAKAAASVSKAKLAELCTQHELEKKVYDEAKAAVADAVKKVDEACVAVATKLKPGVPWTENGTTVLLVGPDGKLHETALNYLTPPTPSGGPTNAA